MHVIAKTLLFANLQCTPRKCQRPLCQARQMSSRDCEAPLREISLSVALLFCSFNSLKADWSVYVPSACIKPANTDLVYLACDPYVLRVM